MNKTRHMILNTQPKVRALIMAAARRAGVTVDHLVQAGLGRPVRELDAVDGSKTAAHVAALALDNEHPGVFKRLSAWPLSCWFCRHDVAHVYLVTACPLCGAQGCKCCVTNAGCPDCVQAAKARRQVFAERAKLVGR